MPTTSPELSVLIVTFNCRDAVVQGLESLASFAPRVPYEVLLIDNASTDGTAAAVRAAFPSVTVVQLEDNVGYGSAMNVLARQATGRYLVFLNPDTVLVEDSLDRLLAFADRQQRLGVLGPRLVYADGSPQPSARRFPAPARLWFEVLRLHLLLPPARRGRLLGGTYSAQDETRTVDWISGACHFIPRSTWETVGPLTEETFCGFDDLEYCMRTRAAGLVNWFYAGTEVVHVCGVSVNARWKHRQVADLAINNMYVVLLRHWGVVRRKTYFAAETFGAVTDVALSGRRAGRGPEKAQYRREAVARVRTLALLLFSLRRPVRRCEPSA